MESAAADVGGAGVGLGAGEQRRVVAGAVKGDRAANDTAEGAAAGGGQSGCAAACDEAARAGERVVDAREVSEGLVLTVEIDRAGIGSEVDGGHCGGGGGDEDRVGRAAV